MKAMILKGIVMMAVLGGLSKASQIDDFKKACDKGEGKACATVGVYYMSQNEMEKAKEAWKRGCELGRKESCRIEKQITSVLNNIAKGK